MADAFVWLVWWFAKKKKKKMKIKMKRISLFRTFLNLKMLREFSLHQNRIQVVALIANAAITQRDKSGYNIALPAGLLSEHGAEKSSRTGESQIRRDDLLKF